MQLIRLRRDRCCDLVTYTAYDDEIVNTCLSAMEEAAFVQRHDRVDVDGVAAVVHHSDGVTVETPSLQIHRREHDVRVRRLASVPVPSANYDFATGVTKVNVGNAMTITARVSARGASVQVPGDFDAEVADDASMIVRPTGGAVVLLDSAGERVTVDDDDIRIDMVLGKYVVVTSILRGWTVTADTESCFLETPDGHIAGWRIGSDEVWLAGCSHAPLLISRESQLDPVCDICGAMAVIIRRGPDVIAAIGMIEVRYNGDEMRVALRGGGPVINFAGREARLLVGAHEIQFLDGSPWLRNAAGWRVAPDGVVHTGTGVITNALAPHGEPEVAIQPSSAAVGTWRASVWSCGVWIEDGMDLSTRVDGCGGVVFIGTAGMNTVVRAGKGGTVLVKVDQGSAVVLHPNQAAEVRSAMTTDVHMVRGPGPTGTWPMSLLDKTGELPVCWNSHRDG